MGAGRKTYTYTLDESKNKGGQQYAWEVGANFKGLNKSDLAGVIFGCTHKTFKECVSQLIFGLPAPHLAYVQNIEPGLPLFLFNYSDRKMHGTFEAASRGHLNLNPYAWTAGGAEKTQFPAQVRVCIKQNCEPLTESAFKNAISENYYSDKHFWFELNHAQTYGLMSLFQSRLHKTSAIEFPKFSETGVWSSEKPQSSSDGWQIAPVRTSLDYPEVGSEGINSGEWMVVSHKGKEISNRKGNSWEQCGELSRKNKGKKSRASSHSSLGQTSEDTITMNSDDEKAAAGELMKGKASAILHDNGPESIGQVSIFNQPITNMANEDRVLEKLKQLAINRQNSSKNPMSDLSIKALNDNMNNEEKSMDDKLLADHASGKVEREIFVTGLRSVDTTMADNLQNYLEHQDLSLVQMQQEITELRSSGKKTYAALAQMQQEITELRSHGKNTRDDSQRSADFQNLEQKQIRMDTEIQTLKEQVARLEQLLEGREVDISSHEDQEPQNSVPSIFLLGGYNGDQDLWLNTLDAYSPQADSIKSLAPMPSVHSYAAATILDKCIYVFGGGNGSLWYNSVERYDQESNSWTTCPSMNLCRGSLAGASLDRKLFALGGGNGVEYFSDVEMFDPFLGSWIPYGTMLQKRFALAGTVLGGALYALGGFDGRQYLKSVERFDPREGHWVQLEEMNKKRGSLSAAVLNENLYAIGGYDGSTLLSSVEMFDPRSGSWVMIDSISSPRGYGATAVLEDSIYVIGGIAEGGYHHSWLEDPAFSSCWQAILLSCCCFIRKLDFFWMCLGISCHDNPTY